MKRTICLLVVLFSFLLPMAIFAGVEAEKEEVKKYEIVLIGKLEHPMFDNTFLEWSEQLMIWEALMYRW